MPQITFIESDGTVERVDARSGRSLMRAAVDANVVGIAGDCGGCMNCATCHVYVDDPWLARLPSARPEEQAMLEMVAAERRPNSRLACQIEVTDALDGLVLHLPEHQY